MPMSMPKRKAMKIQHFHCASVTPGKSISLAPIALVHGKTRGLCLCCAEDKAYALAVPRKSSICLSPWRCGTNEVRAMPFHITAACSLRQLRKTLNNSSGAVRDDQWQHCTPMVCTQPEWHTREEALGMTLAQGQGGKMLQESQSRRWYFVLQIKDALQFWTFHSHPSFCLTSV